MSELPKALKIFLYSFRPSNLKQKDKVHMLWFVAICAILLAIFLVKFPEVFDSKWFWFVAVIFMVTILLNYYVRCLSNLFFESPSTLSSNTVRSFIDLVMMGIIIFFVILIILLLILGLPWPTLFGLYIALIFFLYLVFFERKKEVEVSNKVPIKKMPGKKIPMKKE